jgi:hypothetical protein
MCANYANVKAKFTWEIKSWHLVAPGPPIVHNGHNLKS